MTLTVPPPLRLRLSEDALVHNWRALDRLAGSAACGAAVKANGYGLGARDVVRRLALAGCRDFYVATWAEALAVADLDVPVSVLHGVRAADMAAAVAAPPHLRPVLNSAEQIARWRSAAPDRVCDVMVDTGMNRLGLAHDRFDPALLAGLKLDTLMSHFACADEPGHAMNQRQIDRFAELRRQIAAPRYSLANSAGIWLGPEACHDLVRPGIALYGGVPVPAAAEVLRPVVALEAEILQVRDVEAGEGVGYGSRFVAQRPMRLATLNLGYADGYWRAFTGHGTGRVAGEIRPLIGRVSMDITIIDVTRSDVSEGDWVAIDFDLTAGAKATGMSVYELLTGLGQRFEREWR